MPDEVAFLYSLIATVCTLLCYDHAITLDDEVRLVWKAPWNFAKFCYLFLRYFTEITLLVEAVVRAQGDLSPVGTYPLVVRHIGLRADISLHHCQLLTALYTTTLSLTQFVIDVLLLIRVYAIWGRERKVLILMSCALVANYTVFVSSVAIMSGQMNKFALVWGTCNSPEINNAVYLSWAASLIYECIAFIMTLIKAVKLAKNHDVLAGLFYIVFRDGVGYFIILTILRAFTFAGSRTSDWVLTSISTVLVRIVSVVLTARMFLNLRGVRTHEDWASQTNIRPRERQDTPWPRDQYATVRRSRETGKSEEA